MKYKVIYMNPNGKLVKRIVDSKAEIDRTRVVVLVVKINEIGLVVG